MDYGFRIRHHILKYLMYTKRMIYVLPQRRNNSDGSGKGSMTGSRVVERAHNRHWSF